MNLSRQSESNSRSSYLLASCLIPGFDGAPLSSESKEALWAKFFMGAPPRQRRSVEQYKIVQESLRALAKRYGINQKTVAKWKNRTSTADRPTGPNASRSTVLSLEEEAIIVAFRKHTLLPLDDCLYALQPTIPHLTRSSLHRCLQRHGIGRLPDVEGDKPIKKKFKSYPIGYFHIDIAEVQSAEGKLYLYVAIDRTSKFAFVQFVKKTGRTSASAFLTALIGAVPYKIHTVLTDNGIQFTFPQRYADGPTARYVTHMFDVCCQENGIEQRLTKVKHPWTNGQVERMNRTIKDATVNRYHYDSHQQLETHLADFVSAYNFGRRLKTLKGLTPYEFICEISTKEPGRFRLMRRIKPRTSVGICGRPPRERDFQRQYRRKPIRCRRTIVSGLMMTAAFNSDGIQPYSLTNSQRSGVVSRRLAGAWRFSTLS